MPLNLKDLDDPFFRGLPEEEQYKGRVEVFRDLMRNDPMFAQLPLAERRKLIFPEKKQIISQEEFEQSRNLPPGYSGGAERVPLTADPTTIATGLGMAPFRIGQTLFGGAGLASQAIRGGATGAAFGAVQGAEEGTGITRTAMREGAFGAAAGPAFSLVGRGVRAGARAVRDLFRGKGSQLGSIADAPAGLADEVFGVPALRESRAPLIADEIIDPSMPSVIPMGPPRPRMLPEWNPPPPALSGAVRPTNFDLPPIPPVNTAIRTTPIRLGPPRQEALPPAIGETSENVLQGIRTRFANGTPPTDEEYRMLKMIAADEQWPQELRDVSRRLLRRLPEPLPPPPSVEPAAAPEVPPPAVKSPTRAPRAKGRKAVDDVDRDMATYIRSYMKGINPGALQEEFRSAAGKQSFRFLSKSGRGADEAAEELFEKGYIAEPTVDALYDAIRRSVRGEKILSSQATRGMGAAESEIDTIISHLEGETQRGNLLAAMDQYAPDHPVFRAAERRLKIIDPSVRMADVSIDMIDDGPMKDVLAGNFGPGPYTQAQLDAAQSIANKVERVGILKADINKPGVLKADDNKISFQKTPAGDQGMIPGTEGRKVPDSGLRPRGKQQESMTPLEAVGTTERQIPLPRTPTAAQWLEKPADPIGLKAFTEGDLNDLAAQAYQQGKTAHVRAVEQEFAERMQGMRAPNGDPLDDLGKAEKENLIAKLLKSEEGHIWVGQDPNTNSLTDDANGFFDRWGDVVKSFKDNELRRGVNSFLRRMTSAQELARKHPEFAGIYEPFHSYPRAAVNRHVEAIQPLFKEGGGVYFELPDLKRKAVDKMLLFHKTQRQAMPRMTAEELAQRGLDPNQIKAFNDVLDYGRKQLDDWRSWFVESRLAARVQAGQPEAIARAELEAKFQAAFQGRDHWVPHYRSGDKTVTARSATGELLEYRMLSSVRERVAAVNELKAKYPGANITEGMLSDFVKTKAFDEIDLASLEVLSRLAKVDPEISDQFIKQLRPTLLERSDAMARFKHFGDVPGFKEDLREGLINSGNSTYHFIERQRALRQATDALSQINEREQPELFKFASRFIEDNIKPGEKRLQGVRDALYAYLLGGNLKQFAVQLTQFPTVVVPRMLRFGSADDVAKASATATRWAFVRDLTKAPAELQAAWREAHKQGVFQPRAEMFVGDIAEKIPLLEKIQTQIPGTEWQIERRMANELRKYTAPEIHAMKSFRDFWMIPLTDADMRSRLGAFTGFYELGRKSMKLSPEDATQFAIREANRTNYLYGRAENPELFGRGPVAQIFNMLKTWPANYFSFLSGVYRDAAREAAERGVSITRTADFRTFASSAGAMLVLGGVLHNVPGFVRDGLRAGFGFDVETETRKFLSGQLALPEPVVDATLRGVGSLAGVDISRSIALGDVIPQSVTELAGPLPSVATSIGSGTGQLFQSATDPFGPQPLDALEVLAGGGFKNIVKGIRLMQDQGIATKRGGQLPGTEDLRSVDPALQALGFTPLAVSKAKALQRAQEGEIQAHRTQQSQMYERLGRAILHQDQGQINKIIANVQENNQKAIAEGRPDKIINIDRAQLRQRIAEMVTPDAKQKRVPKNARARQQELQGIYLPKGPE